MREYITTQAIRGAITVEENTAGEIFDATYELLASIMKINQIIEDDIVSAIFTLTPDLNAEFPAKSARIKLGWDNVPMICASEVDVPGSIKKCIRVMITINTFKPKNEIKHVYLRKASVLRPDLAQ